MIIWVDADACPIEIRGIIEAAAIRCRIPVNFVANGYLRVTEDELIKFIPVKAGPDVADDYIADNCNKGDLVITNDVPLGARIVEKGATGIDPRGGEFTEENAQQRLDSRNFMEEMRIMGLAEGGPSSHKATDTREFANVLDRRLTRYRKFNPL